MLCAIYRSSKKDETYLYIKKQDDFSDVPDELMTAFGKAIFVMSLELDNREKLASADISRVKQDLNEKGFYLQVPPPIESLLPQPEEFGWSTKE